MELNKKCGQRLKECIKDKGMTQKELSIESHFTMQYISNIVTGKKPMTITADKIFSECLDVSEKYLLCKSDYKTNISEMQAWHDANKEKWEEIEAALKTLVKYSGYKILNKYSANWNQIKNDIGGYQFETYTDALQAIDDGIIEADDLYDIAEVMYEIATPDGNTLIVRRSTYDAIITSIENYVKFAMDNLKNFCLYDDFFPIKEFGSEIPDNY